MKMNEALHAKIKIRAREHSVDMDDKSYWPEEFYMNPNSE
jgi:hypothetical protein